MPSAEGMDDLVHDDPFRLTRRSYGDVLLATLTADV